MKHICKWIGLVSLFAIFILPFVYFFDAISFGAMKTILFIATIVWFATSFFWIGKLDAVELEMENDPLL